MFEVMFEEDETMCPLCAGKLSADIREVISGTPAAEREAAESVELDALEVTHIERGESPLPPLPAQTSGSFRRGFGHPRIF
jgi:hypothetical protein